MSIPDSSHAAILALALVLLLAASQPAMPAGASQDPQAAIQRASSLLQQDRAEDALEEIERALEANPSSAMAHYIKGMAHGRLGQDKDAQEAFLRACELNPGWSEAHFWAAMSSFRLQDYDTCWEQAILAHLAGDDLSAEFETLRGVSDPPPGFEARINAPRVYVGEIDISALEENRALENALIQSQPYLAELRRQTALAVMHSPHFGLVPRADLAQYILVVEAEDLGGQAFEGPTDWRTNPEAAQQAPTAQSWELESYLKLFRADEQVYRRQMRIGNLAAAGDVGTELRRQIGYLERWLEQER